MDDLIEALTILRKYGNPDYPTNCSHDELAICGIRPADVSMEDRARLDELGFLISDDENPDGDVNTEPSEGAYFMSFRFGSA